MAEGRAESMAKTMSIIREADLPEHAHSKARFLMIPEEKKGVT